MNNGSNKTVFLSTSSKTSFPDEWVATQRSGSFQLMALPSSSVASNIAILMGWHLRITCAESLGSIDQDAVTWPYLGAKESWKCN